MRNLIFAFICLSLVIRCQARTITVDDDGPTDFNNIQAAIDDSNDGDIIEVKVGTYTGEGNQDIDPNGKAITITSTDPNDPKVVAATIIDCNGSAGDPHRGFYFHSDEDADSVLEGLTITNGWDSVGAGISCNGASPTIRHCVISGNRARHQGGGLYCRFSSAVITNCTLRDNTATYGHGGGIFCLGGRPDISTCIISDNRAGSSGGGLFNNNSSPVLLDCDFSVNSAGDYGGGVCNTNNSMPIMTDCTFSDNRAGYCGEDTYSEGEPCLDVINVVTDAKMYNIMSSGGPSGDYQVSGSSGTVYYVNGLCGNDTWSGLDPCCAGPDGPKQTIQAAIDDAEDGDTIIVYPHIYFENIAIETNISLTGIDPNDPNVVEATVIDGGGGGSVVTFAGTEDPNCLLTGFTITNGTGTAWSGSSSYSLGGGIYGEGTRAIISKCIVTGNSASLVGGGIYNCDGLITDCSVNNNTICYMAGGGAGLAYCDGEISGCTINNNLNGGAADPWGAGLLCCNGTIRNCRITANTCPCAEANGGGLAYCNGTIVNCDIIGNSVGGWAGGMGFCNGNIINCVISGNISGDAGGGLYVCNGTIVNCLIADNTNTGHPWYRPGGGLYGCNGQIINCTIVGNRVHNPLGLGGTSYGGGLYGCNGEISNCVIWGNIAETDGNQLYASSDPNYSCIQDWVGGGIGNIVADPCFVGRRYKEPIQGMISYWKFDEGTGAIAYDSAGVNHGTIYGATWTAGQVDGALYFDGADDYIDCGNDSVLDITGSVSISAWVRFDGLLSYLYQQTIVAKRGGETDIGANYALGQGAYGYRPELEFYYHDGTAWHIYTTLGSNVTHGPWYHVVVTFEFGTGKSIKFYLNDNLLKGMWTSGDGNSPVQLNTKPVTIGGLTAGEGADGSIDEVMIFDRALSDEEIEELYQNGISDYHLLPDSPCINAGDPNRPVEANETDIDGQPRVIGGRIDMGADEVVIATMRFTPPVLNTFSRGKWIKAHLVLPEGFAVEDVDDNTPALLEPFGIESDHINVFVNEDGLVEAEIVFARDAFCEEGVNDETTEVRVIGSLSNDGYFYGTDTIRIFNGGPRYVAVLATYWLEAGCGVPDWCGGADLDHSSTVDFVDFALFDGCCIEVVGE